MTGQDQAARYRLKVTAGSSYDPATHQLVPVNEDRSLRIENEHACVRLCVRIQDYTGYPDNSPKTNPYFTHPLHTNDQYSLSFAINFKKPVNGDSLLFGNDFDRPIRDRLPSGFKTALRLVNPGLASWNHFRIGPANMKDHEVHALHQEVLEEGAEGDGVEARKGLGVPLPGDERRKYFRDEQTRKDFVFEPGRVYWVDFGNPYLVFSDFSLRLHGININVLRHIDENNHHLRYVLKNRDTDDIYLVLLFTLVLQETDKKPGQEN
ncbi:uncharacterized protein N7477_005658 [Penicillium maclennaniae]|uniref:uncharacterized protein n=1 Tax=Penicillium maclennaniae TaxID=1343394 RepID=UPI0025426293|nr:uncharacterized protein N7477_005658 [Penicillium maclennaniae]KAJ5670295.1 hypothetical protein N7477_005658 [Penicillium maclennaniae]